MAREESYFFFCTSTVKASAIFQGDLFNEMTSFLQESVVNGFHTTLLATGDLGGWRAREQYLPPECQQFPIRHLNSRTLWKTLYKTVRGISSAWHHGKKKKHTQKKHSAAEKCEIKTARWCYNMTKLEIKSLKDRHGLNLRVNTQCEAILFIKAKVFVNMKKPNLAFFNMEVITTVPNPTYCA